MDPIPGGNPNSYTYPLDPINGEDLDGREAVWIGGKKFRKVWYRHKYYVKRWRLGPRGVFNIVSPSIWVSTPAQEPVKVKMTAFAAFGSRLRVQSDDGSYRVTQSAAVGAYGQAEFRIPRSAGSRGVSITMGSWPVEICGITHCTDSDWSFSFAIYRRVTLARYRWVYHLVPAR